MAPRASRGAGGGGLLQGFRTPPPTTAGLPRPCAESPAAGLRRGGGGCPLIGTRPAGTSEGWGALAHTGANAGLPEGPTGRAAGATSLARGHPFIGADLPGVCEDDGGLWLRLSGASREFWRSRGWRSRAGAPLSKATRPQRVPGTCVRGSGWQGQAWGAWLG